MLRRQLFLDVRRFPIDKKHQLNQVDSNPSLIHPLKKLSGEVGTSLAEISKNVLRESGIPSLPYPVHRSPRMPKSVIILILE